MARRFALLAAATVLALSSTALAQDSTLPPLNTPAADAPAASSSSSSGGRGLGSKGVLSIGSDARAAMGYLNVGGTSGFTLQLDPALDYFIMDHLSLGAALDFGVVSFNSQTNVFFGMEPRVGYAIQATPMVTVWPRAGIEFDTSSSELFGSFGGSTGGGVIFGFDVDCPILFHVADHFYLGVGPAVHTEFTGTVKSNFVGLQFYLGGWVAP